MKNVLMVSLVCLCISAVVIAEAVPVGGPITSVIVYRGQALVTRTLDLPEGAGDMELLVENLPEKILPESLYAQSDGSVSVLSVRFREKAVQEDTRQQVLELKEQIEQTKRKIYIVSRSRDYSGWHWDRYHEQWKVNIDVANRDINTGKFDVETFESMTGYLDQKSDDIHKENVKWETERQDLDKALAELEAKLQKLSAEQQKIIRQALIFVSRSQKDKAKIALSYLVRDADWSAQYNLRAAPGRKITSVEYNAVVHQSSGEDWQNTSLSLSTAQPSVIAAAPMLESMKITLGVGGQTPYSLNMPASQSDLSKVSQSAEKPVFIDQNQAYNDLVRFKRENIAKGIKAQQELNTIAIGNQMIELEADRRMLEQIKENVAVITKTEGVSVMYSLKGKLSLPSRTEQQMLNIASFECPAEYVFVASPLLTDYVYLQADVTNASDTVMLPGPASMFRNGEFVGRSDMKLVTSGQTFTAGFGIDSQIQVVREFADKKTDTILGSRQIEQQYRIALSNYKNTPVKLRLLERIPWTENGSLSIELKNTSHPLCDDAEYLRTERSKGILRWELNLEPNTTNSRVTILTYVYTMKYDKSMSVVPITQNQ